MDKIKTSKKQKKSSKALLIPFKTSEKLFLDRKLIAEVLVEALISNDVASFRDVLIAHLRTVSKTQLSEETGLGRQTLYDLLDSEKFDPKLSTLAALLNKIAS